MSRRPASSNFSARTASITPLSETAALGAVGRHTTPRGRVAKIRQTTDAMDLRRLTYSRPFSFFSWQVMQ